MWEILPRRFKKREKGCSEGLPADEEMGKDGSGTARNLAVCQKQICRNWKKIGRDSGASPTMHIWENWYQKTTTTGLTGTGSI
jgi:hypothetical protein